MSKKPRSKRADCLVYLAVRFLVCILQMLSYRQAKRFSECLAWLIYRVDRRHNAIARDNLLHAFPEHFRDLDPDAAVRATYRHFCLLLMEIIHVPRRVHWGNWRKHLEIRDPKRVIGALLSGRPLMFVTGHFGNWELGGYALGMLGFRTHAIARELDNVYLDRFLRSFRERTGQGILAKNGDFDKLQAILATAGVVATLADQDGGQRGLFVDFFGRPASTHKAVALLALQYHVPLLVIGVRRIGEPIRYQLMAEDLILPEEYDGRPDAVKAITQRFTSSLERIIRTAPDQYFWLHRRWKHQPLKRKGKQAA
jgi:KDO2-lipid IV(A) lauroyltransferase